MLIERANAQGVRDTEIAAAVHAANTALEYALGADRAAKRARLTVNPQAAGGGSRKRLVAPGKPLGAGQRAVPVPRLSKAPGVNGKKRAKLAVLVNGPSTEKAARAAKKAAAAKAKQLKTSARVAAELAASAGAACAAARVKRKESEA